MIDFDKEEILSFEQAAAYIHRRFGSGRKPSVESVARWCNVGLKDRKLESLKVGAHRVTSKEAIVRFFIGNAQAPKQSRKKKQEEPSVIEATHAYAMMTMEPPAQQTS